MESGVATDELISRSDDNSNSEPATAFAEFAANESRDVLSFYELEGQILALYDHLNDLKLEIALLEAQHKLPSMGEPSLDGDPTTELKVAEKECLEARAAYLLRNSVVENVLVTDPILKAVHSGANATPVERFLHPLIDRRDILAIAHTNMSTGMISLSKASTLAEAENIRALAQNRESATTLINLANQNEMQRNNAIRDSGLGNQVERLRADTRIARTRWKIMKSVVSAVIVGSGMDWAAHDELRDLVLDEEVEGS